MKTAVIASLGLSPPVIYKLLSWNWRKNNRPCSADHRECGC